MIVDIYAIKEYIMKELTDIDSPSTLHEILCTVLQHNGIPYMAVRRAHLRNMEQQLKIWKYKAQDGSQIDTPGP